MKRICPFVNQECFGEACEMWNHDGFCNISVALDWFIENTDVDYVGIHVITGIDRKEIYNDKQKEKKETK
jgi:hypothetical protein